MKLSDLGFDGWFEERAAALRDEGVHFARVAAVDRGACIVRNEQGEVPASLAGKLTFRVESAACLPCVGDWVAVTYHDAGAAAVIRDVFPRRTFLRRKRAGEDVDFQMIAANIDTAFIVQSCHFDFNVRRMDRYLVAAADGGVEPVVVLTKTDLIPLEELEEKLEAVKRAGVTAKVLALSSVTGAGIEEFERELAPGRTHCLLGSSGVGKTTLINRLLGRDAFGVKAVSGTGEGTHATARRQLILLEGGAMLIDTPGMRELGLIGGDGVGKGFADVSELSGNCRFADCGHTGEPGCAVREAVASGALSEERYESFLKLRKESEHCERSYAERRKRDRAFGRFIHSSLKRMKDKKP